MLARHGNMTKGKLNAIESTNPILMISLPNEGDKLTKILPGNKMLYQYLYMYVYYNKIITGKAVLTESHIAEKTNSYVNKCTNPGRIAYNCVKFVQTLVIDAVKDFKKLPAIFKMEV